MSVRQPSSVKFRILHLRAVAILVVSLWAAAGSAQLSEGPLSPGTVANDNSAGTSVWVNPQNADASNDMYAVTAPGGTPSQFLKATSFGFSIPPPAQITGIEVHLERTSAAGSIDDSAIRIVKGQMVGTADRSAFNNWDSSMDTVVTYGSDTDLWGETWTPADINAAGFGAAIAVNDGLDSAGVDHISITVYYTLCADVPAGGCRAANKSVFVVKDNATDAKDKLIWKWIKGVNTSTAEFADPINTAVYSLCVYEDVAENLIANVTVPPSSTLWRPISTKGFKYLDKLTTQDGVLKIVLKASVNNKSKAIFKGKGTGLPDITPALTLPVKVQLVNSDTGVCWEASYDGLDIKKNEPGKFKAVAK